MCRLIRVLLVSVPLLFVFLVAPSAFAQSWISAVTATTTTTTATITWTTAVPANSQITYGTTTSYGSSSSLNSNLVTTHSAPLTSLTAGTTYHYRVLSSDSTGVLVTGLDNVFTTPAAAISVSVSPTTTTVASGGTEQFSAQVTGTSNTAVTWSTTGGTVTTNGLYTAPATAGTYTVTATSVADTSKSASASVTVTAAPVVAVSISPGSASLFSGGTQQFAATVTGTSNTAVTWSTTGGTITTNGLYTAPATAGTYTVTATSVADTSKSASASVTVTNPSTGTPAFVQVAGATPQSPQSTVKVVYPAAQTAGNLNVVVVGWNDSTSKVTSVSDSNGNVYSLAVGPTTGTGVSQSIYYAKNIVSGSNAVTVTFDQAAVYPDIRVLEYAGLDTVSPLDVTSATAGNGSSASSGPATTTATNELILGANTIATITTGVESGFTSRIITSPDSDLVEDKIVSTTGSYNATASLSSGSWVMQMAAFKVTGTAVAGQLTVTPTTLGLGSVVVGTSGTASGSLTASGANVTVTAASSNNPAFSVGGLSLPVTIPAGQSATFTVKFTPASAGSVSGNVTITSNASNPNLTIPLSGTGVAPGALGSNPTSLNFGSLTVGTNQLLSETVTNTGASSVTISQVGISGTGYSLKGITVPLTLMAGQSATFSVAFAPQSTGSVSGNVTVTSNASNSTLVIPLSGTGSAAAGQLSVTPTTLGLGSVVVGTSGTASGSLTASGANVTVTAASSNNSAFSVGGLPLPVTIPAGQSASFTVTFSPQVSGVASSTLTFTSNAQPTTTTETLTGTGTTAPHTVSLSWTASTSPNISGYNIYRAVYTTSCGSFSKINSVLNTTTSYTDSGVTDGATYCYATTAVNTSNEESGYSNVVSNVQVPAT